MVPDPLEPDDPLDVEPDDPLDVEPDDPLDVEPDDPLDVEPDDPLEPEDVVLELLEVEVAAVRTARWAPGGMAGPVA